MYRDRNRKGQREKPWIKKSETHIGCALNGLRPCYPECLKAHGEDCSMRVKWYQEFNEKAKGKKHKCKQVVIKKVDAWKIVEAELHGKKVRT